MVSLKSVNVLIEIILAIAILAGSAFWSWTFFSPSYLPPTTYYSLTVLNSPISSDDDKIIGQVILARRKNCPGIANRSILRVIDNKLSEEIIYRDAVPTAASHIGDGIIFIFKVPVPRPRISGNYVYRSTLRFDCDGRIFTIETPAAPFQIR